MRLKWIVVAGSSLSFAGCEQWVIGFHSSSQLNFNLSLLHHSIISLKDKLINFPLKAAFFWCWKRRSKTAEMKSTKLSEWSGGALEERQLITHNKDNSKAANKSIASQTHFLRN